MNERRVGLHDLETGQNLRRLRGSKVLATFATFFGFTFFGLFLIPTQRCPAGMGPENLVVVVNADSPESRTIAAHYVEMRKIPTRNVIFLANVPTELVTSLDAFRDRILKPLLEEIEKRGISGQVRGIAYSAHFPYAVNIQEHRSRLTDPDMIKIFTPVASINGLTYFFRFILADREEYLSPGSNLYARMKFPRNYTQPFSGEDADKFTAAKLDLDELRYEQSATAFMELFEKHPTQAPLGVLAARGLSDAGRLDAAMEQLTKSAAAGWASGTALENEPDLAAIKEREDFKALVKQLGDAPYETQLPLGFEAIRSWTPNGWWNPPGQPGVSYLPSCMLAMTRGAGTTVDEAITQLTSAVSADNTFPDGTVYLATTKDVRTKTRLPEFGETFELLQRLGRKSRLINTAIPQNEMDVIGVCFGVAKYDWPGSGNQFVPGAIGDNLTSTSGVMKGSGQTVLSALLRGGAAIASGTVAEPYALQFKFPLPQMHAYYADGFSALESYYLSVSSPYQLLIVGDPLCQPFARQPVQAVAGRLANVDGTQALVLRTPLPASIDESKLDDKRHSRLSEVEIYVDGRMVQRTEPTGQYVMKMEGLAGGSYELRTVLVGESPTAARKSVLTWFDAEGLYPIPKATMFGEGPGGEQKTAVAKVELTAIGADSIRLMHFGTEVARLNSDQMVKDVGTVELDLVPLGDGPIRLRPVADYRGQDVAGREFVIERKAK